MSAPHRTDTTNGRIDKVLASIATLIEWAESDAQHAAESGAPATARDDRRRLRDLVKAEALIERCKR